MQKEGRIDSPCSFALLYTHYFFRKKVYTFRAKLIYLFTETYIPFHSNLYTFGHSGPVHRESLRHRVVRCFPKSVLPRLCIWRRSRLILLIFLLYTATRLVIILPKGLQYLRSGLLIDGVTLGLLLLLLRLIFLRLRVISAV